MTIVHRPGKENQNADALSRNALPNDAANPACDLSDEHAMIYSISIIEINQEWFQRIKTGYEGNVSVSTMLQALISDNEQAKLAAEQHLSGRELKDFRLGLFFELDGLLYKRVAPLSSVIVIADKESIVQILKACHDSITSGHWSYDRTLDRVRKYAYFFNKGSWSSAAHRHSAPTLGDDPHGLRLRAPEGRC